MAVAIKLTRFGKKDFPIYRIVVADKRKKRDGDYLEKIGSYNPHSNPAEIKINEERLNYWLNSGAILSEGVIKILKRIGFRRVR